MFFFPVNKKKLTVSIIIALIALVGDKNTENQSNKLASAICDNVTHALIGIFTWIGIHVAKTSNTDFYFVLEIVLCGLCSSLIDADHFIAAKSINLKDATHLKSRPFMHCTTLVTIIVLTLLTLSSLIKINWLYKVGWILAVAFFSHHVRDSKRRGFWLWPLGSTPPTPEVVYIVLQMFLPQIFCLIMNQFSLPQSFKSESAATIETV